MVWLIRGGEVDSDVIDGPGKCDRNVIAEVDGSTGLRTDIEGFHAYREADRDGVLDPSMRHLCAVGEQGVQTALADAAAGSHRVLDRNVRLAGLQTGMMSPRPRLMMRGGQCTSDGRISAVPYDPERWHDFSTSFAGASGALLGLAFVAISFNLDAILRDKTLPGRAIETLVFFAYPLAGSLLIQVPGLSDTALGVGQAILAAGLLGLAVAIDVPRWRLEQGNPLRWRISHLVPPLVTIVLAIVGAVATITASFGGLYWLAGAMAVATMTGLTNSWVLLVEIKR